MCRMMQSFKEDSARDWNEEARDVEPFGMQYIMAGGHKSSGCGMARSTSGHARGKFTGKVFTREHDNALVWV
jgi:hypothetical protein